MNLVLCLPQAENFERFSAHKWKSDTLRAKWWPDFTIDFDFFQVCTFFSARRTYTFFKKYRYVPIKKNIDWEPYRSPELEKYSSKILYQKRCTVYTDSHTISQINRFTRLHPQGKGGPDVTYCVRDARTQYIMWVMWRDSKFKSTVPTNLQILGKNLLICSISMTRRTHGGHTDGRSPTNEHRFFWSSLHNICQ